MHSRINTSQTHCTARPCCIRPCVNLLTTKEVKPLDLFQTEQDYTYNTALRASLNSLFPTLTVRLNSAEWHWKLKPTYMFVLKLYTQRGIAATDDLALAAWNIAPRRVTLRCQWFVLLTIERIFSWFSCHGIMNATTMNRRKAWYTDGQPGDQINRQAGMQVNKLMDRKQRNIYIYIQENSSRFAVKAAT